MKKEIVSNQAPGAIGPYSQAVQAGNMIFVSGQLPINAATGEMPADIEKQTEQSILNIKAILEAAGATLDNVVKTTAFLADMSQDRAITKTSAGLLMPDLGLFPDRINSLGGINSVKSKLNEALKNKNNKKTSTNNGGGSRGRFIKARVKD